MGEHGSYRLRRSQLGLQIESSILSGLQSQLQGLIVLVDVAQIIVNSRGDTVCYLSVLLVPIGERARELPDVEQQSLNLVLCSVQLGSILCSVLSQLLRLRTCRGEEGGREEKRLVYELCVEKGVCM